MDRQPSTCTENRTTTAVLIAFEHTVGKDSSAWERWWGYFGRDVEGLGVALYGALLSLGAPPHPQHLTQDLTDIALAALPPWRPPPEANDAEARVLERRYNTESRQLEQEWKRQLPYNKKLNAWAKRHGYARFHKTHDLAQFRKLFAAFVLHACKGEGDGLRPET